MTDLQTYEPPSARWNYGRRREALAMAITNEVARGGRVESQSDTQAVVVHGRRVNHLLHFIVGIVTITMWWFFVWIPLAIFGGEKRTVIVVDEYGNTQLQRVSGGNGQKAASIVGGFVLFLVVVALIT